MDRTYPNLFYIFQGPYMLALLIGNFFSLLSAIALGISVVKRSKKDLMHWQIGDATFGTFANIALQAYAATAISVMCVVRNVLSYKGILTQKITYLLVIIGTLVGWYTNNLGFIGWLPIIAAGSYTFCIYFTKNEQQMRWALIINLVMWFVHNVYVQSYPSAIGNVLLMIWTTVQALRYRPSDSQKS